MLLRVNPVVGIWGFESQDDKQYGLWFTLSDPKPQDINVEELPNDLAQAVLGALRTKTLIEVNKKGKELRKQASQVLRPAVTELGINPVLEHKAKTLLSGTVSSVRREASMIVDSLLLATAIAVEKSQKNRKTVKDVIERQMIKTSRLRKTVAAGGGSALESAYGMAIVETEEETITCGASKMHLEVDEPVLEVTEDLD